MERKKFDAKRKVQATLVLIFGIYFLVLAVYTPNYSSQARLFPTIVLLMGFLLLVLEGTCIVSEKARKMFEPAPVESNLGLEIEVELQSQKEEENAPKATEAEPSAAVGAVVKVILWLVAASILFYTIGIVMGTFVSTALFFALIGEMKWYKAIIFAAVLTAVIYLVFDTALGMRLYKGIFF